MIDAGPPHSGVNNTEELRRAIAATLLPGFVGTTLPDWVAGRLSAGLGGVCVFGVNIESTAQLSALTAQVYGENPNALVGIDEEGGDVTRLHYASGSPLPGNALLGRIGDLEYTKSIGRRIGEDLRRTGFNLDFAPDADINSNADNPVIGVRSFGVDPTAVAEQVVAWTSGLQAVGVAACAKHFPGHGDTSTDSHLALPVVNRSLDQLREREFVPFRAAIAAGTRTIMSSHILLPQLDPERPATMSRTILTGLLRGELGFDGVIVSDALDMAGASGVLGIPEAAVRALDAGCDLLCIGASNTDEQLNDIENAILTAIGEGRLAAERVMDAATRVRALAETLAAERSLAPVPAAAPDPNESDVARVLSALEVRPGIAERVAAAGDNLQVVSLDAPANSAIGFVPWGLAAELAADPARYARSRLTTHAPKSIEIGSGAELDLPHAAVPIVIGRNIHLHPAATDLVDRVRKQRPATVVVDMGWPGEDRDYADIATFGASRLAGRALAELLDGGAR